MQDKDLKMVCKSIDKLTEEIKRFRLLYEKFEKLKCGIIPVERIPEEEQSPRH